MATDSEFPTLEVSTDTGSPLYRRIAEAICQAVLAGQLTSGQRLPARKDLAETLQTSPVTVGRGYEWLHGRGLVDQKRRSGTWLRQDALDQLQNTDQTQAVAISEPKEEPHFSEIVVVLGQPDLAHLKRDWLEMVAQILTGVSDVLGERVGRFRYVSSFDRSSIGDLPADSAVLIWRSGVADPASLASSELLHELTRRNIPLLAVWSSEKTLGIPRIEHISYQAVNLACQHLLECGYRRLGYIGEMGQDLAPKFFEFTNVLFKAGLDFQFCHVREVGHRPGEAYRAATEIAGNDLPDAFFVDTDWKALEVVAALSDAGVRVPEDVGVVGYGDIPDLTFFDSRLTTVRLPRREIGQAAGRSLLAWAKDRTPLQSVTIDAELVVRETTTDIRLVTESENDAAAAIN